MKKIHNSYEDEVRARSYANLEFPNTYYLAYRDLPKILQHTVKGKSALDFGCGTGRSTRFLSKLGFESIGIDISDEMIQIARSFDPDGDYKLIKPGDFSSLNNNKYDLVMAVFTFDNIPDTQSKLENLTKIRSVLKEEGSLVMLVSTPDIYINEWASFSTRDFPNNWKAKSGDNVQIIMTDVVDSRPVDDVMFSDESYRKIFKQAGFIVDGFHQPLGADNEGFEWLNETRIAPWSIYILKARKDNSHLLYKYLHRL